MRPIIKTQVDIGSKRTVVIDHKKIAIAEFTPMKEGWHYAEGTYGEPARYGRSKGQIHTRRATILLDQGAKRAYNSGMKERRKTARQTSTFPARKARWHGRI